MSVLGLSSISQSFPVQSSIIGKKTEEKTDFKEMLMDAIADVSKLEKESDAITEDFIAGKTDSIHSVLIAAEKASISLEMVVEVRNKVLDAYNEIMRMQI